MYKAHPTPEFQINPHLLLFMQQHPFLASISRQIRKICTREISTAGVSYDPKRSEIVLWWNDLFFKNLTVPMVHGVIKHELLHLVFRHITSRRRRPHWHWNVGTDMCIDHIIWLEAALEAGCDINNLPLERSPLPAFAKTPGKFPHAFSDKVYSTRAIYPCEHKAQALAEFDAPADVFDTRSPTEDEKRAYRVAKAIETAPGNMTSDWYFHMMLTVDPPDENRLTLEFGSMDSHDEWDELPEEIRERVEGELRNIIARAVRDADTQSNGWGHTPAELQSMIRKSVSNCIDWREVVNSFIGSIARGKTRRTITRPDRKYGLGQPGIVTGHVAQLVMVIDQSGSVDNAMLAAFFAELENCTQKMTVTILPFDADCKVEEAWVWQKGQRPQLQRTRCGGTDFDAPTNVINQYAHEKGWEGAIFMTDGECSKPGPCYIKRAWVIGPGRPVPAWIDGDETVISMEPGVANAGAWY